jgi:predicted small lipoprotein YifL
MKVWKRMLCFAMASVMALSLAACGKEAGKLYFYDKTADDVAAWKPMETPSEEGGGSGSVTKGDNAAVIKAAFDGWGGVQSEKITLDLTKEPVLMIQVKENADGFKWGAKFVPSEPVITDHEWGFYLIEDTNFKYNNYAAVDLKAKLGQDFIDAYGEKVEGVLWIYAAGSPDAVVEISSVKMFNQK